MPSRRQIVAVASVALVLASAAAARGASGSEAASPKPATSVAQQAAAVVPVVPLVPATQPVEAATEVIAHRGDVAEGVENTPPAIRAAVANGAPAVEFDVVWTRDNVPVVLHDTDLAKNTLNCTGRTHHLAYADFRNCLTKDGKRAPSLVDMLAALGDSTTKVYVHVKTRPGLGIGAKIVDAVDDRGRNRAGRVVYFGDKPAMLEELREAGAAELGLIFYAETAAASWASNYSVLVPFRTPITPELVEAAQDRGQRVIAVEMRPASLAQAKSLGVDAVIANDLAAAQQLFD